MAVPQEEIDRVRAEGRARRRPSKADRRRLDLAPVVDTGLLDDDDVLTLWAAFTVAKDAAPEDTR